MEKRVISHLNAAKIRKSRKTTKPFLYFFSEKPQMAFVRQLGKRMGWTVSEVKPSDTLYDPESKSYLSEETMQAIRDVESGNVKKCKSLDDILATL